MLVNQATHSDCKMPPSSQRSSKSAEESHSNIYYIDIDIHSDAMVAKSAPHESRRSARHQAASWVGATDQLHINLQIEVGGRSFHLHKFPLLSKSGKLNRLVFESRDTEKDRIVLSDIPGGADAFELVTRFLYGAKFEQTPQNVAALRCAGEYLEMSDSLGDGNLIAKTENYLNFIVMGSWRDSITVLQTCAELVPWAEDLEIVRRCNESVAWKCSTDPHGIRWSFSSNRCDSLRDWWFDDVCSLSIDMFSKVIHAVIGKRLNHALVAAAVGCYAEKWLQLTNYMSTTSVKTTKEEASFMAFTGFNQDIVANDATKQAQHKNRGILQGVVHLLPQHQQQSDSMSVKFLLKLLRVACAVDAGSFCKTDLAKRIGMQLERVSVDDLLIPAYATESAYDVDIVQQIVEFYLQDQNYANSSPPFSPRSNLSGSTISATTSLSSSLRSDLSGSSMTTESSSTSGRTVSGSSASDSSSVRSSSTGTSSSSLTTTRSGSLSFLSTSSETTESSEASDVRPLPNIAEKRFYVNTEGPSRIRSQLPPTTANFKLGQLLETYLEEVARDSSISLGKFITLADLFTEFPRDSDDGIYRAIDTYLRAHPSLTEMERKKLCRVIDTGALSLAACVHAASNERLPLRVIVQVLFGEQIKLRNAITGNDVINDKDLDSTRIPGFSSDPSSTTSSSSSIPTKSRSNSISSASGLSVASSQLIGGLSLKETMRFVIAEVESLRKAVQEVEIVKSRLSGMESLQLEMENLSARFQEMSHDYIGMTQQVEDLTRGSKQKSGWSSGWKKVTKSFQTSKDHHDSIVIMKAAAVIDKIETQPLPRIKIAEHATDIPPLPSLTTSKSETTLLPKTPNADTASLPKAEALPVCKPPKAETKPTPELAPVIVTPVVSMKAEIQVPEPQPANELEKDTPPATNKPDGRRKSEDHHRGRRQHRSTSPRRRSRHHSDSDTASVTSTSSYTASVTSTSSYTSTPSSVSSRGSRHHRHSTSRSAGDKHHTRHHRQQSSHRHHREGSEHHSHHSGSQNNNNNHLNHTELHHHRGHGHRSSGHRKDAVDSIKHKRHRHHRQHHSDSDTDSDRSAHRRRHR